MKSLLIRVMYIFGLFLSIVGQSVCNIYFDPYSDGDTTHQFLKCILCQSTELHGLVGDCTAHYETVNQALNEFYIPALRRVTSTHFRIDLQRHCPFWSEDDVCTIESCSVGVCAADEVPESWVTSSSSNEFLDGGWVSMSTNGYAPGHDNSSEALSNVVESKSQTGSEYVKYLKEYESKVEELNWTDMTENDDHNSGTYVNLLHNPERYTGYSGPSAQRVWSSIMEENCFGCETDTVLEKRIFYRLVSGLRASISTHIAREYYFESKGEWGINMPLFVKVVGSHPNRVNNLYFTFLFLLRSLSRARTLLANYSFSTGNITDDESTRALIRQMLYPIDSKKFNQSINAPLEHDRRIFDIVEECNNAFDESAMFGPSQSGLTWEQQAEKMHLLEDFRNKFRNISRIMDCVTCEKCRLWGKLQILGIGTALKILLSPRHDLDRSAFLTRQEIVALLNVIHQVGRSVQFASKSADIELEVKLNEASSTILTTVFAVVIALGLLVFLGRRRGTIVYG